MRNSRAFSDLSPLATLRIVALSFLVISPFLFPPSVCRPVGFSAESIAVDHEISSWKGLRTSPHAALFSAPRSVVADARAVSINAKPRGKKPSVEATTTNAALFPASRSIVADARAVGSIKKPRGVPNPRLEASTKEIPHSALDAFTKFQGFLHDNAIRAKMPVLHTVLWETPWLPVSRQDYFRPDGKYLFVTGSHDYCAGVKHFHLSLTCLIAEAAYLNRTLILDMTQCVNAWHSGGRHHIRSIHVYYDLDSLRAVPFTPLQGFLRGAREWQAQERQAGRDGAIRARLVDSRAPTVALAADSDTPVIVRETNFGFSACKRHNLSGLVNEAAIKFRPELLALAANISASMNGGDFDAVHVRRGDKLRAEFWPHLDRDTRPQALLEKLPRFVAPGRTLYIATNEKTPGFFDPLKGVYPVRLFEDFQYLWAPGTPWYDGYQHLLGPDPKMDAYMEVIVEYAVLRSAKRTVETFNDLTLDIVSGKV